VNGFERICAVLRGDMPEVTPVMLHNFMMAARESGVSMNRYRSDPNAIARCFIESIERYQYDGIVIDVDTATLAGALGAEVAFPEDEPAVCIGPRLQALDEVRRLPSPDIASHWRVQVWLEAARLLKQHFGDTVYLRGNCDQSPFSLAAAMRGSAAWMMDIMDPHNEQDAHRLLDYCAEATLQFIRLMSSTGVHMISNGDSAAGPSVVSPRIYQTFAQPYERRAVLAAHQQDLPYALHICGKTEPILPGMLATGADALELDHKTNPRTVRDPMRGRAVFIGNLDPTGVIAFGEPHHVEEHTRELIGVFAAGGGLILNAGCAIPATTPPQNIRAMIRIARESRSVPYASRN
jgi:MtaA/CmuA family methyltransferase